MDDFHVKRASKQIAEVLSGLEAQTGQIVTSLSVERVEVTNIQDAAPRYLCSVRIELQRLPGHDWDE